MCYMGTNKTKACKPKYYAFISPIYYGIFTTWDGTKECVLGESGVLYKKFSAQEDAIQFIKDLMKPEEAEKCRLADIQLDNRYIRCW